MGILEFHFHDCSFSPSMNVGEGGESETESTTESEQSEPRTLTDTESSGESARRIGLLVALVVFVFLGALVKRNRRGSEETAASAEDEDIDVSA